MPLYHYQCLDCAAQDPRLGGLDDHTAICVACGGLMLRLDLDLFQPYFDQPRDSPLARPDTALTPET